MGEAYLLLKFFNGFCILKQVAIFDTKVFVNFKK